MGVEASTSPLGIQGSTLREFVEFRKLVEPAAAALAAERASESFEETLRTVERGDFDLAHVPDLHLLVAEATGNGVLAVALNALHHPFSEHFRAQRIFPSHMRETSAAHAKIARLIRTGDIDGAREAMTVHLDAYADYLEREDLLDAPIIPRGAWEGQRFGQ